MTTVDDVRKALEDLRRAHPLIGLDGSPGESGDIIAQALVKEGLSMIRDYEAVKAEYDKLKPNEDDAGYRDYIKAGVRAGEHQISFLMAILRTAGRMSK